uniref:Putative secreted protein n=1 Tax=Anopheles marajoara TaxID=58244 RepID=A0A2M4C6H1_9DIPT
MVTLLISLLLLLLLLLELLQLTRAEVHTAWWCVYKSWCCLQRGGSWKEYWLYARRTSCCAGRPCHGHCCPNKIQLVRWYSNRYLRDLACRRNEVLDELQWLIYGWYGGCRAGSACTAATTVTGNSTRVEETDRLQALRGFLLS